MNEALFCECRYTESTARALSCGLLLQGLFDARFQQLIHLLRVRFRVDLEFLQRKVSELDKHMSRAVQRLFPSRRFLPRIFFISALPRCTHGSLFFPVRHHQTAHNCFTNSPNFFVLLGSTIRVQCINDFLLTINSLESANRALHQKCQGVQETIILCLHKSLNQIQIT